MTADAKFDALLREAQAQQLKGWDFSWLNARTVEEPLPWDYRALALERMSGVSSLLDVGTGGGEFLAALLAEFAKTAPLTAPLPTSIWATEGYPPNVGLARARLEPLGVQVVDVSGETGARLPLADRTFDLVIDRHEGLPAAELARVLRRGGRYLTQQVGGQNCVEINRFLRDPRGYVYAGLTLDGMLADLEGAGLRVLAAREVFPAWTFKDVAGVVFYLQAVPWQVADFSVETYRERLHEIHRLIERDGGWTVHEHRLLIEASLP